MEDFSLCSLSGKGIGTIPMLSEPSLCSLSGKGYEWVSPIYEANPQAIDWKYINQIFTLIKNDPPKTSLFSHTKVYQFIQENKKKFDPFTLGTCNLAFLYSEQGELFEPGINQLLQDYPEVLTNPAMGKLFYDRMIQTIADHF